MALVVRFMHVMSSVVWNESADLTIPDDEKYIIIRV